jgi:hypothetical protein
MSLYQIHEPFLGLAHPIQVNLSGHHATLATRRSYPVFAGQRPRLRGRSPRSASRLPNLLQRKTAGLQRQDFPDNSLLFSVRVGMDPVVVYR